MNNFLKYYSTTYKLLDRLFDVCKYGYNEERYKSFFIESKILGGTQLKDGKQGLMLTIFIALLGINKEKIEKDTRYSDYENDIYMRDIRDDNILGIIFDKFLKEFDDKRQIETGFDSWLSVTKNSTEKNSNKENLKMIRNGFLHSQYELEVKEIYINGCLGTLPITNLNNKNYFNCSILNYNFYQFVYFYFCSNPNSLKTENYLYSLNIDLPIENKDEVRTFLEGIQIKKIDYEMDGYDGTNSLEAIINKSIFSGSSDKILYFNDATIREILNNVKGEGIDLKESEYGVLPNDTIEFIISYINEIYGEAFYNLEDSKKRRIIMGIIECAVENTSVISNWLINFYHLLNSLNLNNLDLRPFAGDEYVNIACMPTLLILKGYLILYRMQNPNFDDLEYYKIDINLNDLELYHENIDGTNPESNYFEDMLKKIATKHPDENEKYLINKMICEIIRNAFAHGNIYPEYEFYENVENVELKKSIILEDVYKGKVMGIKMPLEVLDKFLNSEAFLPKNCYTELKEKTFSKRR